MPDGDDYVQVQREIGEAVGSTATAPAGSPPATQAAAGSAVSAAASEVTLSDAQVDRILERVTAAAMRATSAQFEQFKNEQVQDQREAAVPDDGLADHTGASTRVAAVGSGVGRRTQR